MMTVLANFFPAPTSDDDSIADRALALAAVDVPVSVVEDFSLVPSSARVRPTKTVENNAKPDPTFSSTTTTAQAVNEEADKQDDLSLRAVANAVGLPMNAAADVPPMSYARAAQTRPCESGESRMNRKLLDKPL